MTTLITYPCREAYAKGIKDRQKYPFVASSLYKIREFHGRLETLPDNLINIGKCSVGDKNACNSLRGCDSWDKAVYAKKTPRDIAYDLSFKLVSALPSLKHEGLAQHDLHRITAHVNSEVKSLIDLGEQASSELKTNWKQTARHLGSGEGGVYEFSLEVLALLDWVMMEAELCKP
jgi:hypothetical protein